MKYLFVSMILLALNTSAQESKEFIIEGKVRKTAIITLASLKNYKVIMLDSMTVFNHLLERKGSIKNIKGILLKDILSRVEIVAESPKKLSEYYIILTATDNYKVVYSWNELFNSSTGDHTLLLLSYDSEPVKFEKNNIALITTTDNATGRRFLKGLSRISILQVN
ncbi:MAG: molybdopterin-binding protein [Bacteroidota bacterium]